MESKAITQYQIPKYPKKEEVLLQPALLRRSITKRWQRLIDLGISGMLIASVSLSGCSDESTTNSTPIKGNATSTVEGSGSAKTTTMAKQVTALVAPIFEHGQGRGATGCVVVGPPVFLSEDEAFIIIKEELSKHGIKFNKKKVVLNDIMIQPGNKPWSNDLDPKEPLEIDFQDSGKGINIEYICQEDYRQLGGENGMSTVQSYDMKKVALQVRKQILANSKQGIYGIFYDPMNIIDLIIEFNDENVSTEDRWKLQWDRTVEQAKELLRQQVQDFAKWLQEQEVI